MRPILPLLTLLVTTTLATAQTLRAPSSAHSTQPATTRPHFTLGKATTRITSPLLPDGRPDYVRALDQSLAQGVTHEDNAVVILLEAFGTGRDILPDLNRAATLQRLGISGDPRSSAYQSFSAYLKQVGIPYDQPMIAQEEQWRATPWNGAAAPQIARWVLANDPALDQVVRATQRDGYYWPMIATTDRFAVGSILLPGLGRQREVGNSLLARAMRRYCNGQIKDSLADFVAVHRLARLSSRGACVVEKMAAMRMETLAAKSDIQLAPSLAAPDAKAYLLILQKLPPRCEFVEAVDIAERYLSLDAALSVAAFGPQVFKDLTPAAEWEALATSWTTAHVDWDTVLTRLNADCDRIVAALRQPTFAQRKAALAALQEETNQLKLQLKSSPPLDPTRRTGDQLVALLLPSFGRASEMAECARQRSDLALLAIALAAYHGEHSAYPEKLADLAPAYLKDIPPDLFANAPLIYKKQSAGYLLYSLGPDLKDDHGTPGKTDSTGDLVIHMSK